MTENLFFVEEDDSDIRIDKYLADVMEDCSRSYLQKLLKEGNVLVNGKDIKSSYKVRPGDSIELKIPELKEPEILPEKMDLDIVYEDKDVILINKPKGMVVHPAAGHYSHTLVNGLMEHCKEELSGINGVMRPGIVHRIDMDTTGILIVCKNDFAHNSVAEQLKEHSVTRRYYAIVHGNLKQEEGKIDAPLGRHPIDRKKMAIVPGGKHAVTHYRVVEHLKGYTWIECRLETGRTHQIRVHMASIGHPLVGDEVYGPAKPYPGLQGQTLHAYILGFVHPRNGEYMEFSAELPEYFQKLLIKLRV